MKYCNRSELLRITKVFGFSLVLAKSVIKAGITRSWSVLSKELAPTVADQSERETIEKIVSSAISAETTCLYPKLEFRNCGIIRSPIAKNDKSTRICAKIINGPLHTRSA